MKPSTLVVISPLKGVILSDDRIILTQKFIDGMKLYSELWGGPILHLCEPGGQVSHNLDNVEVAMNGENFTTLCAPLTDDYLRSVLPAGALVVSSVGEQFNSVAAICKELGIGCVYITEYSLKTRCQIISEYQSNPIKGAWQKLRQAQQEVAQRRAIAVADGVQCNGLPTFQAYEGLNKRPHLFFDTRTESPMLASSEQVSERYFHLAQGRKLRLTFSGRITLMKGVDDLIKVASLLRSPLDDWFEMSICGDGDYASQLRSDVDKLGLGELVKFRGNLEFKSELIPLLTNETDIFVCCHRQGDPSCTYLETMACGVPIIGYANEAWEQLSGYAGTGWVTKLGSPKLLAEKICQLQRDPFAVTKAAEDSLRFATAHTFEKTFDRRVAHFKAVLRET